MMNSSSVDIDGLGMVLFECSKRAKRVNISVKPFIGVRVAVPDGLSFEKAEEFVHAKTIWIQRHLCKMRQYEKYGRTVTNSSCDIRIERAKAKRKLTRRLKNLAEKYGFIYNRIFIRNQKTRWGSCSNKNNISLNVKIIRLPEELMDYVILHELTHTRVKDHSHHFWAELDGLVANGKGMASKLKEYELGLL
ncbi:M48 family metallopeptidase [Chloroflexota bacterium]